MREYHADTAFGTVAEPPTPESDRLIHTQHYNVALVRAVLGSDRIDGRSLLETTAAELAFQTLHERGAAGGWSGWKRWRTEAEHLFRSSGLGGLELREISAQGGTARVTGSHFAAGWRHRHGEAEQPVCALPTGFIAGALAAAFGRPFEVRETSCAAQQGEHCSFTAVPAAGEVAVPALPAAAPLSLPAPRPSTFDEAAVLEALGHSSLDGDGDGRIEAFGGEVTRVWADYYSQVSYRFEQEVPRVMGVKFANLPSLVLTEAGHTCAFHTFGGLMRSPQWTERVAPLLQTREDWLHAAVALINALGWGSWRVQTLVPGERVSVRVYDGYESLGYLRHFGRAAAPKCYLARGTVAALMNLLYVGDITQQPELTPSYYNQLFRSPLSFRAVETRCRTIEDPYCELIANPLSPGLLGKLLKG